MREGGRKLEKTGSELWPTGEEKYFNIMLEEKGIERKYVESMKGGKKKNVGTHFGWVGGEIWNLGEYGIEDRVIYIYVQ